MIFGFEGVWGWFFLTYLWGLCARDILDDCRLVGSLVGTMLVFPSLNNLLDLLSLETLCPDAKLFFEQVSQAKILGTWAGCLGLRKRPYVFLVFLLQYRRFDVL